MLTPVSLKFRFWLIGVDALFLRALLYLHESHHVFGISVRQRDGEVGGHKRERRCRGEITVMPHLVLAYILPLLCLTE